MATYETVLEAIRLFHQHGISRIPVISGEEVIGSVNEVTLVRVLHRFWANPSDRRRAS